MENPNGAAQPFGSVATNLGTPEAPALRLPPGRVEAVLAIDVDTRSRFNLDTKPGNGGRPVIPWRLSFEWEAFAKKDGVRLADVKWMGRVSHVLFVLSRVIHDFESHGYRPVYARKEADDQIVIGLWRHPRAPKTPVNVSGYTVTCFEVEPGTQCALGFDTTTMSQISQPEEFAP